MGLSSLTDNRSVLLDGQVSLVAFILLVKCCAEIFTDADLIALVAAAAVVVFGYEVKQLVDALSYNLEGRGFDSRFRLWDFTWTSSFRLHYGPGIGSVSNRNKYQEYFLGG